MLYIKANHLTDGLYNIKDGEIFKYKAKGGTVRTYEIGNIVHCQDCKYWVYNFNGCSRNPCTEPWYATDFCNYGERESE